MEVLAFAVMGAVNILCFMIGAKVGQAVKNGNAVEMPTVNPVKIVQKHKEQKELRAELDAMQTILNNIDNYNGTSIGQADVPRG